MATGQAICRSDDKCRDQFSRVKGRTMAIGRALQKLERFEELA
jgi:hypothetical protein